MIKGVVTISKINVCMRIYYGKWCFNLYSFLHKKIKYVAIPNCCGWSKLSSSMFNDRLINLEIYNYPGHPGASVKVNCCIRVVTLYYA